MNGGDHAHSFAKAEAVMPLLGPAAGFVPSASRAVFESWAALLGELREAVFELSDPRVTAAKVGWWAEEIQGMGKGASRHPVARALATTVLPWGEVAGPLLASATEPEALGDEEAVFTTLHPLASALSTLDAGLSQGDADVTVLARRLTVHWLRTRMAAVDPVAARVPMTLWARHGLRREQWTTPAADPLRRDWAQRLHVRLGVPARGESLLSRLLARTESHALAAIAAGRAPPRHSGFALTWAAWRCARDAALHYRLPAPART